MWAAGRIFCCAVFGLWSVLSAQAADGVKASATASRGVPADIAVLTFAIAERASPSELGGGVERQHDAVKTILEARGFSVLGIAFRYAGMNAAFNTASFNLISADKTVKDPVEVRRNVTFRVTGFKRAEDVLHVLGQAGVRQPITMTVESSKAAAIRSELRREAIELALAHARQLAAWAGAKPGNVVDLAVQGGQATTVRTGASTPEQVTVVDTGYFAINPDQTLVDTGATELPTLTLSATAQVVLALRPD